MTLEQWADWGTILEGFFTTLTFLLIWRELRENRRTARAASMQTLAQASTPFFIEVMKQRDLAELWHKGGETYASLDATDQLRYRSLLMWMLEVFQSVHLQQQEYPLSRTYYQAWLRGIDRDLLEHASFAPLWKELSSRYSEDFRELVEQRLNQQKPASLG